METKMKLETVDRITYGLKACAREHSEWYQETLKSSQSSLKGTLYRIPSKLFSKWHSIYLVVLSPASAEPPMIWLQSNAMENPIISSSSLSAVSATSSSHLKAPAIHESNSNLIANSYLQPEECLKFLAEGFDELLKCRSVRIHPCIPNCINAHYYQHTTELSRINTFSFSVRI